jgi:hypothetical protein
LGLKNQAKAGFMPPNGLNCVILGSQLTAIKNRLTSPSGASLIYPPMTGASDTLASPSLQILF